MRDPKRIPKLLGKLQAFWEKDPDMRLGQLVSNLAGDADVFYVEDSKLERNLGDLLWHHQATEAPEVQVPEQEATEWR